MPQHAQERRNVKAARSARMVALLENAPILLLVAISFGGSYGNIARLFGECGAAGLLRFADAACPDLLCFVAAREILRDIRIKRATRDGKLGRLTWPVIVLVTGIAMTLALNYEAASEDIGRITATILGHATALLPGVVLLLAISVLHRRESAAAAVTQVAGNTNRRPVRVSGNAGEAAPVTPEPPAVTPETETETAAGECARKRTDEEWVAEVRRLHGEQGDALSVRKLMPQLKLLGGGSGIAIAKATEMLRQVKAEAGSAQASEEAV